MQENVMALFKHYSEVAYIISILLNIVIAIFALILAICSVISLKKVEKMMGVESFVSAI